MDILGSPFVSTPLNLIPALLSADSNADLFWFGEPETVIPGGAGGIVSGCGGYTLIPVTTFRDLKISSANCTASGSDCEYSKYIENRWSDNALTIFSCCSGDKRLHATLTSSLIRSSRSFSAFLLASAALSFARAACSVALAASVLASTIFISLPCKSLASCSSLARSNSDCAITSSLLFLIDINCVKKITIAKNTVNPTSQTYPVFQKSKEVCNSLARDVRDWISDTSSLSEVIGMSILFIGGVSLIVENPGQIYLILIFFPA